MTKQQMEQIVLANMQKIYLYCVRRLGNATDAEDVASDITVELLSSFSGVKDDRAVLGYVWAVADNLCRNYWRRAEKYGTVEIPEDYVGMHQITAEEDMIHREDISLLRRELALLSERYREVMIGHYIRQESCEEIARRLQISQTNVKQYLFEGRKKVRKGMEMQREYGVYSYAPEKFTFNFWGDNSTGLWELFERKLPGNIMLSLWDSPKTMEELSTDVGVAVPYLEEDVAKLEEYKLLVRKGNKYRSGIIIYDKDFSDQVRDSAKKAIRDNIDLIKAAVEKGKSFLKDTGYQCYMDDENTRGWFILMLIIWEAVQASEGKMKTQLTFPLLGNGYKGYVMGLRGEDQLAMRGIYGRYMLGKGYLRAMNYNDLTDKVVNPFERGAREVLLACEDRLSETAQLETLTELLETKLVHIEDGKICPNFAEIPEKDYEWLMENLSTEIDAVAAIAAQVRDNAGDILAGRVPKEHTDAREIGGIVSMWSLLENLASVILEIGYLTGGNDEQNLTTFYFRT
ncbi:MAG: sigma-70 family RNA polymerase sigma factor [Clostridia bacterium]|nr:sigma-70 family RNA polymerase sigma factor [Clostridia bacterium]